MKTYNTRTFNKKKLPGPFAETYAETYPGTYQDTFVSAYGEITGSKDNIFDEEH